MTNEYLHSYAMHTFTCLHLPTDARLVQMALSLGPNQTAANVVGE